MARRDRDGAHRLRLHQVDAGRLRLVARKQVEAAARVSARDPIAPCSRATCGMIRGESPCCWPPRANSGIRSTRATSAGRGHLRGCERAARRAAPRGCPTNPRAAAAARLSATPHT
eukprot:3891719-Prymnesium_polylepis.2